MGKGHFRRFGLLKNDDYLDIAVFFYDLRLQSGSLGLNSYPDEIYYEKILVNTDDGSGWMFCILHS
jgi:hypothetical protein